MKHEVSIFLNEKMNKYHFFKKLDSMKCYPSRMGLDQRCDSSQAVTKMLTVPVIVKQSIHFPQAPKEECPDKKKN